MNQEADYSDDDLPPPLMWVWLEVGRNFLVVAILVGFTLLIASFIVARIAAMRRNPLPTLPEFEYSSIQSDRSLGRTTYALSAGRARQALQATDDCERFNPIQPDTR